MILIVGLGNPEEKYLKTRHNLGFMVLDQLARKMFSLPRNAWKEEKKFSSLVAEISGRILLVKPLTFMNASGLAAGKLASFYKIASGDIWVFHDDVDIPLGKIKIRFGGAAAGHHGVESIIEQLGTDQFWRFRLGIGHPGRGSDQQVERYVLRDFDINEKTEVKKIIKKATVAVKVALEESLEAAMNRFN